MTCTPLVAVSLGVIVLLAPAVSCVAKATAPASVGPLPGCGGIPFPSGQSGGLVHCSSKQGGAEVDQGLPRGTGRLEALEVRRGVRGVEGELDRGILRRGWGWALGLRAGGGDGDNTLEEKARDITVSVSTAKISSYVDARGEVKGQSDWTVSRLAEELEKKFPGRPPAAIQRLFKGTQLLPGSMTLGDAAEGVEDGKLSLLLDIPPPIDTARFDPDTAVPASREGQLEAFCSGLAAQNSLQKALAKTLRGDMRQDDHDLSVSLDMRADFDNIQAFLKKTSVDPPETSTDASPEEVHGPLHEVLRPLAKRLDVNWAQSVRVAVFIFVCARFGSQGALREVTTALLIPLVFVAQTRWARVMRKTIWGVIPLVPGLPQLIVGFLQAPEQVLLTLDEDQYVMNLYGPRGPRQDKVFLQEADVSSALDEKEQDEDLVGNL